jgi:hypothetical protein
MGKTTDEELYAEGSERKEGGTPLDILLLLLF